jgi:thiol-disulfide isomerase/thioredoxin
MSSGLYKKTDGVVILNDSSISGSKLKTSAFKGAGVLKAYATWCPHCQDKVGMFKKLAELLAQVDMAVYTVEAAENRKFSQAINLQYFPTIMFVDEDRSIKSLPLNNDISIDSILNTLCEIYSHGCSLKQ